MNKVYISGQISGLEYKQAKEKFESAEILLESIGLQPINPMKNGLPIDSEWEQHMVRDIEMLLECDAIMMLDNWRESKGAKIEQFIAEQKGLTIMYESFISTENNRLKVLKDAIEEVTGMSFEKYTCGGASRDGYLAKMIFTRYCIHKFNISMREIPKILNRSYTNVTRYINNYENEIRYNKRFREMAEKVEIIMNNYVSH